MAGGLVDGGLAGRFRDDSGLPRSDFRDVAGVDAVRALQLRPPRHSIAPAFRDSVTSTSRVSYGRVRAAARPGSPAGARTPATNRSRRTSTAPDVELRGRHAARPRPDPAGGRRRRRGSPRPARATTSRSFSTLPAALTSTTDNRIHRLGAEARRGRVSLEIRRSTIGARHDNRGARFDHGTQRECGRVLRRSRGVAWRRVRNRGAVLPALVAGDADSPGLRGFRIPAVRSLLPWTGRAAASSLVIPDLAPERSVQFDLVSQVTRRAMAAERRTITTTSLI